MSSGEGRGGEPIKATLAPVTNDKGKALTKEQKAAKAVQVHFNPESLDLALSNNFSKGAGDSPVQLVDEATEKLSLDLQFDTTLTGVDVRQDTGKIAAFLKPLNKLMKAGGSGRTKKLPPPKVVEFEWGAIVFQGYIDSYSETLEYFSSDGVPLRAKVSLSLTHQERSFEPRSRENPETGAKEPFSSAGVGNDPFAGNAVEAPVAANAPIDNAVAAANNIENARRPESDVVALPESGDLGRAPAAFASAAAGFGGGLDVGAGIGAAAGLGLDASAGIGGTAAAFAGLSVKPPKLELKPAAIADSLAASVATTGPVAIGGAVKAGAGASLTADVRGKIDFGGD
ncbi:MAG: phage tail protein [Alphaproteobacteria bacterium]|nr:phage tail protein [Alphaproteobacteria bacterium]